MEAYRKILMRTGNIFLLAVLTTAAVTGMITYPAVAVLGSGFDEGRLVTTLSVMLAGLCLARLLAGLTEQDLSPSHKITLILGAVTALLVPPLRNALPFVLKGYVFPLLTGLSVPRLLLFYASKRGIARRFDGILAAVSGGLLLLLVLLMVYGGLFAVELVRLLICRIVALPLLWFAPLFDFYAKRCGVTGRFTSIALLILPLFPITGILWDATFRLAPVGILLCLIGIGYDNRRLVKAQIDAVTQKTSS